MLRLNATTRLCPSTFITNLNTSHVKVKLEPFEYIYRLYSYLNTSHVKVKHVIGVIKLSSTLSI